MGNCKDWYVYHGGEKLAVIAQNNNKNTRKALTLEARFEVFAAVVEELLAMPFCSMIVDQQCA